MTILRPLPGDAGTVHALADRLAGQGELLLTLASALRGLGDPGAVWDGPAGTAFGGRCRAAASLLTSVGRRCAVSAVALRPLAAALAQAQLEVSWAVSEHADALPRALALGDARVLAEQGAEPSQQTAAAAYHRQEIAQLERVQLAEHRHAAAWQRFCEADRRCASVLHGLVQDGLADSRTYDVLTGLSRGAGALASASGAVAMLPLPPAKALGVAGAAGDAVQVGADTTVRLVYGDGSWGSIALAAGSATLGPAAGALKRGALAVNPAALGASTRTARRLLRYDTAQRLKLGVSGGFHQAGRPEPKANPRRFRATRNPGSPSATAHWAAEQVAGRTEVFVRNTWLDDLALVTGDPARSRTMMVTGLGTQAVGTGIQGAGTLRDQYLGRQEDRAMQARDDAAERGPDLDPRSRPGGR